MNLGRLIGNLVQGAIRGQSVSGMVATARSDAGSQDGQAVRSTANRRPDAPVAPVAPKEQDAAAAPAEVSDRLALTCLRGMIAAAAADGQMDDAERVKIVSRLEAAGLEVEDKAVVLRELAAPWSADRLAAAVGSAMEAEALYRASLIAITLDTDAEFDHMRRLATALGLKDAAVRRLHGEQGAPPPR